MHRKDPVVAFGKKYTVHDGGGRQGAGESADVEANRRREQANAASIARVNKERRDALIKKQAAQKKKAKAKADAKKAQAAAKKKGR
jgi:hypothetical protein